MVSSIPCDAFRSSVFLLIGTVFMKLAMVWCRQAFRLSGKIREHVKKMFSDDTQLTVEEKAVKMRFVFTQMPVTVSELIHRDDLPHGVIFRALIMVGAVLSLQANLTLFFHSVGDNIWGSFFHTIRSIIGFTCGFGIALVPSSPSTFEDLDNLSLKRSQTALKRFSKGSIFADYQTALHAYFAFGIFLFGPLCEFIALGLSVNQFCHTTESFTNVFSVMFIGIAITRFFVFVNGVASLPFFAKELMKYFDFDTNYVKNKGFWAEFMVVISYINSLQLCAIHSWFIHRDDFEYGYIMKTILTIIALWLTWLVLKRVVRNLLQLRKNFEFSDKYLAYVFDRWEKRYKEVQKRILDQEKKLEAVIKNKNLITPKKPDNKGTSNMKEKEN